MDINLFIKKLASHYNASKSVCAGVIEEYGNNTRIDWELTYKTLKESGKPVTHIGVVHNVLTYKPFTTEEHEPEEQDIRQLNTLKRQYINQDFDSFVRKWFFTTPNGDVRFTSPCFSSDYGLIHISIADADLLYEIAATQPDSAEKWLIMRWREELEESKTRWLERIKAEGPAVMFAGGE